ncbi:MAG: hypothetical protein KatS3mg002_0286 [Candidatus Woesearchaeota archaeon]|nr:MAG: hypothetical protein KatS3mg002_0286 [Candidatus Woesearchaeota archaeon]
MNLGNLTRGIKTTEFWLVIAFLIITSFGIDGNLFSLKPDQISNNIEKVLTYLSQAIAVAVYIWSRVKYKVAHIEKVLSDNNIPNNVNNIQNLKNDNTKVDEQKNNKEPEEIEKPDKSLILLEKVMEYIQNSENKSLENRKAKMQQNSSIQQKSKKSQKSVLTEDEELLLKDLMKDKELIDLLR